MEVSLKKVQKSSKSRSQSRSKASRRYSNLLGSLDTALIAVVLAGIAKDLDTEDGQIKNTLANVAVVASIDQLFKRFVESNSHRIESFLLREFTSLHNKGEKYFGVQSNRASSHSEGVLKRNLSSYGISNGKLKKGGLIHSALTDTSPIRKLKGNILAAINTSMSLRQLGSLLKKSMSKRGFISRSMAQIMPDPIEHFDRLTDVGFSQDLKFNYAIYQGGEVRGTRPFCKARNGKVFHRDEILKFGTSQDKYAGYSNKSTGEFQGKPDNYNPLTDVGGIRCRHHYDWISDELAEILLGK